MTARSVMNATIRIARAQAGHPQEGHLENRTQQLRPAQAGAPTREILPLRAMDRDRLRRGLLPLGARPIAIPAVVPRHHLALVGGCAPRAGRGRRAGPASPRPPSVRPPCPSGTSPDSRSLRTPGVPTAPGCAHRSEPSEARRRCRPPAPGRHHARGTRSAGLTPGPSRR